MVEGLLPLPELHQDVDVAFRGGLAPHDRPEDTDACHAVAFPDGAEVLADQGERVHICFRVARAFIYSGRVGVKGPPFAPGTDHAFSRLCDPQKKNTVF